MGQMAWIGLLAIAVSGCTAGSLSNAGVSRLSPGESRREAFVQTIHSGETLELAQMNGPGIIRHIWFTARCDDPRLYGSLILRIWWDGEKEPSIEAPMSDFFGSGFGLERAVQSGAVQMIPAGMPGHAALNCWLPMPFESARIEIENQSDSHASLFHIMNWEAVDKLDKDLGRLHAQWRRSNPVARDEHHTVLKARGNGQFAGMVYSIRLLEGGSWVEGGEDFYIDRQEDEWEALEHWDRAAALPEHRVPAGERSIANQPMGPVWPTLPGIGAEDYFTMSWGFREKMQSPYAGVSLAEEGYLSAYRFHLKDPIRFRENLWVQFRNHGWDVGSRADDITTLAFWYQKEPHAPFPDLPPLEDRLPPPRGE